MTWAVSNLVFALEVTVKSVLIYCRLIMQYQNKTSSDDNQVDKQNNWRVISHYLKVITADQPLFKGVT